MCSIWKECKYTEYKLNAIPTLKVINKVQKASVNRLTIRCKFMSKSKELMAGKWRTMMTN